MHPATLFMAFTLPEQEGILKVLNGQTTIEEVVRATQEI